jgi:hypothetical protein
MKSLDFEIAKFDRADGSWTVTQGIVLKGAEASFEVSHGQKDRKIRKVNT